LIIEKDRVVSLFYQLYSLGDNQTPILIEERSVDDPLEFLFGRSILLPKVEQLIKGKSRGFHGQVDLHPNDAFGIHHPDLVVEIERSKFPKEPELQLGMKFQTQGPKGDVMAVIVKEINDDKVLVDGNHPLAGLHLRFDLKILRVREALPEEIASGEVKTTHLH
jgi:FKBP-type peptidyl-prolyl cis-trans isomerase SlyD